jgi:diphosphomevalonate decarboxylase
MHTKQSIVQHILKNKQKLPGKQSAEAFASSNIALCKYWGKRNDELNLPVTNSLSMSLGEYGTRFTIRSCEERDDILWINHEKITDNSPIKKRLSHFLDLFRPDPDFYFHIDSHSNIPIAAGLASSASAFAALIKSLDQLFCWECTDTELSILARLGSGSACRSLWPGFVEWQKGTLDNGMDSHGVPLNVTWADLRLAIVMIDQNPKTISSRVAMKSTVDTSPLYRAWPDCVSQHLVEIKSALMTQDIEKLGRAAEQNALAMHATMMSSQPGIIYSQPETLKIMQQVWQCRAENIPVYFTQDAGANLKLLFTTEVTDAILARFPQV